jgi:acyl carrier protein
VTPGRHGDEPAAGRPASASTRSIQRVLEVTWQKVLQVDQVDVDDNFFELGGTSLDAIDVVDRLNHELGTDISEIGLFERPTIRAMTELLRPTEGSRADQDILDSRRRGGQRRAIDRGRSPRHVRR